MNTSILKKCLEELNKENPRKDYVIGMLETLIETQESIPTTSMYPQIPFSQRDLGIIPDMNNFPVVPQPLVASDETTELANAYTRGPVATVS